MLLLTPPLAAHAASVSLPTKSIPGVGAVQEVVVTADTTAPDGVVGAAVTVTYDLARVKATGVTFPNLPSSCSASHSIGTCSGGAQSGFRCGGTTDCPGGTCVTANDVRLAFGCSDPLVGSSRLAQIVFQGVAAGSSTLSITQCSFNEGNPACGTTNGSLTVSTCVLDVDGSGKPASSATDVVYANRRLLGLPPVPSSFRSLDSTIPSDAVISANVDLARPSLDVDANGQTSAATDIVYINRRLLGLPPVPSSFRTNDPTIPSDSFIAGRVDALCP